MSTTAQILVPVALLVSGLAGGVLLGSSLGPLPLMQLLPSDRYVQMHGFFARRYDPFMPICLATTVLCNTALAFLVAPFPAAALFGISAVLAASTMAVSVTTTAPINRWMKSLDPDALPPDWERLDPRVRWRKWHLRRTALAVLALAANAAAVSVLVR
jgi:hypothetical protein